jgi:hypothetical protein
MNLGAQHHKLVRQREHERNKLSPVSGAPGIRLVSELVFGNGGPPAAEK